MLLVVSPAFESYSTLSGQVLVRVTSPQGEAAFFLLGYWPGPRFSDGFTDVFSAGGKAEREGCEVAVCWLYDNSPR